MSQNRNLAAPFLPGITHHALLWLVIGVCLWFAWTGYVASDDAFYATAGAAWAYQFPYVAPDFAAARFVIAIPIGIMIRLLGESEFSVTLSTCLFFAATASLTLVFLSRLIGAAAATVACCVMATVPIFALKSTITSADLPELFFVAASVWLFWLATQRERRFWLLVASGACVSLAFGAHEVTGGLILGYGVLFLAGFGIPRREYWLMAIGFFGVIALECLYYWIFAGNPMHRLAMLMPIVVGTTTVAQPAGDRVETAVMDIALGGTIHFHQALDPVVMFFTHHDFGLLGFAAVPALWWCCVTMRHDRSSPLIAARMFAALALVWFLFSAVLLRQAILITRYYMVVAYFLFVIIALWAALGLWPRRARLLLAGAALFVAVNLLSIFLDEKNPRFGERALVEYLGQSTGTLQVDPNTASRVRLFCKWSGQDCSRIKSGPPVSGLYFHYPTNVARPSRFIANPQDLQRYRPVPDWEVVWRSTEPAKPLAGIARILRLDAWMPAAVFNKLAGPGRMVVVYRLPAK